MNKQAIFAHYSAIIDSLIDNSSYFGTYFQRPWSCAQAIEGGFELPSVTIETGALRACIVDMDMDYVVKFDIEDDFDGSCCERECNIYTMACELGLEKYLCEVEYIGTYRHVFTFYDFEEIDCSVSWYDNDVIGFEDEFLAAEEQNKLGAPHEITVSFPLYAYRRVRPGHNMLGVDEYITAAKSVRSPLTGRNVAVAASFIAEYGMDEYIRFSDFAAENGINDLHCGNIGGLDGHFIVMDYAGYHDGYEDENWE